MRPAASGRASARSSSSTRSVVSACSRRALSRSSLRTTCTVSIQTKKRTKTPKRQAIRSPKAGQMGVVASCSACCSSGSLPSIALLIECMARFGVHSAHGRELAQLGEELTLETKLMIEELMCARKMRAQGFGGRALTRLDDQRLDLAEPLAPCARALIMRVDRGGEALDQRAELSPRGEDGACGLGDGAFGP